MKNKRSKLAIILMSLLLVFPAFATKEIGNGGDAIVCDDGTVLLLDYYEALKRGFKVSIPGETLSHKVDELSRRFISLGAIGMNNWSYLERIKDFKEDLIFSLHTPYSKSGQRVRFSNELLVDIPDSHETSIPAKCRKEQLIIRKNPEQLFPGDSEFEIRFDLWKKMDLDNQAMAVNHEILYWGTTVALGAEDSRAARFINGIVAAGPGSFDPIFYIKTINKFFSLFKHFQFRYPNSNWAQNFGEIYEIWMNVKTDEERVSLVVTKKQNDIICSTFTDCLSIINISFEKPHANPSLFTQIGLLGGTRGLIIEADRESERPFSYNFVPGKGDLNDDFTLPNNSNKDFLDYVKFEKNQFKDIPSVKIIETRAQLILEGQHFIDHCRVGGIVISRPRTVIFNDPELTQGRSLIECR